MLSPGSHVPAGSYPEDRGGTINLSSVQPRILVLYVYPKDNTPGCTDEACSFRDHTNEIIATAAVVVGVSPDSVASHTKFKEKFSIPFTLISDPGKALIQELGAWGEKSMYGKKTMGILRSTFLFDEQGILEKVWPKVSPKTHGDQIVAYLKERTRN